jgi:hypothetical protein
MRQAFNDSSGVSGCLNQNNKYFCQKVLSDRETMADFNDLSIQKKKLNERSFRPISNDINDYVENETYLSRYKLDYKAPNISSYLNYQKFAMNKCECSNCIKKSNEFFKTHVSNNNSKRDTKVKDINNATRKNSKNSLINCMKKINRTACNSPNKQKPVISKKTPRATKKEQNISSHTFDVIKPNDQLLKKQMNIKAEHKKLKKEECNFYKINFLNEILDICLEDDEEKKSYESIAYFDQEEALISNCNKQISKLSLHSVNCSSLFSYRNDPKFEEILGRNRTKTLAADATRHCKRSIKDKNSFELKHQNKLIQTDNFGFFEGHDKFQHPSYSKVDSIKAYVIQNELSQTRKTKNELNNSRMYKSDSNFCRHLSLVCDKCLYIMKKQNQNIKISNAFLTSFD